MLTVVGRYNKVLLSKYIWKEVVQCENVLVTQTDALLLSHGLEEFFQYAYVGAPVYVKSFPALNWRYYCTLTNRCGGHGGLSLRTRTVMLRALDECQVPREAHDEDVWFSACLIRMGPIGAREPLDLDAAALWPKMPPQAIANRFSTGSACEIDNPIGMHKLWSNCKTSSCVSALRGSDLFKDVVVTGKKFEPLGQCAEGEATYLAQHPNVAAEVKSQKLSSGWEHYTKWGRADGKEYHCFLPDFASLGTTGK